jgi:hypothetical protein
MVRLRGHNRFPDGRGPGIAGEWLDSKIAADMSIAALAGAFVVGFAIAYQTVRAVV